MQFLKWNFDAKPLLLALWIVSTGGEVTAGEIQPSTNVFSRNLQLFIEPSVTSVASGTARLNVGLLSLKSNAFLGDYEVKVVPYFFQNEKGKLSIEAPAVSLAKLTNQIAVEFVGRATSTDGTSKRIDGTITPADARKGTVSLWFMAGKRKMIFNTSYSFVGP